MHGNREGDVKTRIVWCGMLAGFLCLAGAFAEGEAMLVKPESREKMKVGGPCDYVDYAGTATITKMEISAASGKQVLATGGPGYPGCEIWFSFKTDALIRQDWARKVVDREHLFRLANSWYPGEKYIDKYGIKVGNTYTCILKVLTRGTCTPAVFKFPGCKDDDYFESKKEE